MVAARFLGITFSMTLHGSDLLLDASHMEKKLSECKFCLTVSEFNRRHIFTHYPGIVSPEDLAPEDGSRSSAPNDLDASTVVDTASVA